MVQTHRLGGLSVTTIHTLRLAAYKRGDIASLPRSEPDPFAGWPAWAEDNAHDLRSIRAGDTVVASFGYYCLQGDATSCLCFAVIDRQAVAGHADQLVEIFKRQTLEWMHDTGVTTAYADCPSQDRAARVFLRAIGYRPTVGDDAMRSHFQLTRG